MPARHPHVLISLALLFCLALAGLMLSAPANAKNEAQAEADRLSDDIEKLAGRQIWAGVERKYRELERLETDIGFEELMNGATAARELGDVEHCYQRLKAAAKLRPSKDVVNWLWDIDNNYGHVELLTVPSRSAELAVNEMPFDPNQRKAVEAAVVSASSDGIFVGMLPKGKYTFASQSFEVQPGLAVRIEVSPRMRRQGLITPVIIYRDEYGRATVTGGKKQDSTDPGAPEDPGASSQASPNDQD
ncbi:MAG: hypothetical protein GXP62_20680 [Oligoflexia bacterium]|nr:hypothetical protein [Oligoflexia bacterium]